MVLFFIVEAIGVNQQEQQDPQEFNKLFLDRMDSLYPSEGNISSIIQGDLKYIITCSKCHTESIRHEKFLELGLNIEGCNTLERALERYFCDEDMLLRDNNGYFCSTCDEKQDACRRVIIEDSPDVLFIQLLRYIYDKTTFEKKKLHSPLSFPALLRINDIEYTLTAVLYHRGRSAYGGHYVCEVMDWKSTDWWHCDDEIISKSTNPTESFVNISSECITIDVDEDVTESTPIPTKKRRVGIESYLVSGKDAVESSGKPSTSANNGSGSSATLNVSAGSLLEKDRLHNAYMLSYVKSSVIATQQAMAAPRHAQVAL